ncbi:stalk domain-containing protein [Paenibacillus cymbidii]|uniref:stalk domain-containing protein n=1 Tax=Paenibacillus cymbidii TaxID=1639034 RepID=UPI001081A7EA|nr:stalk domain-containing protein [Paenibacillus cymbidii]
MKKKTVMLLLIITGLLCTATGGYAATSLISIQAYLNGELKFKKDGVDWHPIDSAGNEVLPITYDGTTYLPLRVFANSFQIPVDYDQATNTVLLGKNPTAVTLYGNQIKTKHNGSQFFDILDKSQLVFGGKQFEGAFAFEASYSDSYSLQIDLGKAYTTMHLIVAAKDAMNFRVYNGENQMISPEYTLNKNELKEVDVDLKGTQFPTIHAYSKEGNYPLIYILKDSTVK